MATITELHPSLRTARLVAASMVAGITMFATVSWTMIQDRGAALDPAMATPFLYAWIAVAFGCVLAALIFWRINIGPRIERTPSDADPGNRAAALQSALVVIWALMEGPALFALVIYFLFATPLALAAGLLMAWLGIGLTFPRAAWFPANAVQTRARDQASDSSNARISTS